MKRLVVVLVLALGTYSDRDYYPPVDERVQYRDNYTATLSGIYLEIDGANADTTINIQTQDLTGIDQLVIGRGTVGTNTDLYIYRDSLDTTNPYLGTYIYLDKTAGASSYGDNFTMLGYEFYMSQLNGEIGSVYGLDYDIAVNEGQVGNSSNAREVVGLEQSIWIGDGSIDVNVWGDVYGWNSVIQTRGDANITDDIFGIYNEINLDSGTTIGDDVYGYYGRIDDDAGATGTVYLMYLDDDSGVDWCIYQDGTAPSFFGGTMSIADDLVLPKTSGNGIRVDTASATFGWRDLLGEIRTRGVGATDPGDATYIGNIKAYQFAVNDECWVDYHIPHDYVPGTDIHLHFHWSHNSAIVTGGSITWGADVTYAKGHNQAAFAATVNTTVSENASTTQYQHMIAEVQLSATSPSGSQIDSDDLEPDGVIMVRGYLSANNITSSGAVPDPFLHFMDVHFQTTNIGTKAKAPNFYN
jgi:hypothetical protein